MQYTYWLYVQRYTHRRSGPAFFFLSSGGWGKNKAYAHHAPRIFIHARYTLVGHKLLAISVRFVSQLYSQKRKRAPPTGTPTFLRANYSKLVWTHNLQRENDFEGADQYQMYW